MRCLKSAVCLLISLSTLYAEEPSPLYIDSEQVNYNGKIISLEGHAVVDHELGRVEAQTITLHPGTGKRNCAFLTLQ